MPEHDDQQLIAGVLAGDEPAIREFVRRMNCIARILRHHNARFGRPFDEEGLEDLAQNCVLLVWGKLHEYSGQAPLESWVYQFCYLDFMNQMRKRGREHQVLLDALQQRALGSQTSSVGERELEDISRGLSLLGSDERRILHYKHFQDLTFDEIGETLNLPTNTIKSRYYRGLKRLREFLGKRGSLPPATSREGHA